DYYSAAWHNSLSSRLF
nr:immunoglobulin light chain junction region [Macaca mulatta]MOV99919.1 immunoglobulin light chain junction region [Macaca mulatta]